VFILVVERNSIGSQAIEGGNFHISQNDALSGMEFGASALRLLMSENRHRCTRI